MSWGDSEREPLETMTGIQLSDLLVSQNEFRCAYCFNFLWPPIILTKIGNMCGNCQKNDSAGFIAGIRNIPLEKTLEKLSIRCLNSDNGCKVRNHYKEMILHNKKCLYRKISCPINSYDHCLWMGYYNELVNHFTELHPEKIIKPEFDSVSLCIDVEKEVKQIKAIVTSAKSFLSLISIDKTNQKLSLSIFLIDDPKSKVNDYQFVVQLNSSISHETNKFDIVNISDYSKDYNGGLKMDIESSSTDGLWKCSLKITSSNLRENGISEELLRNLECPLCNNYMRAPIYQCLSGHSICNECKSKLKHCHTCRSSFGNTRNFALEFFGDDTYFPCSFFNDGCEQHFLLKDITKHKQNCTFEPYNCPFVDASSCNWTGSVARLPLHLKDAHKDLTYIKYEETSKIQFFLERQGSQTYCLMTYDKIFRVSYKHNIFSAQNNGDQNAYWTVQLVGPKSDCKSYSYEITLIKDNPYPCKKFTVLDLCQEYTHDADIFNHSVKLPLNVLSDFLNNDQLTYIVKILKTE